MKRRNMRKAQKDTDVMVALPANADNPALIQLLDNSSDMKLMASGGSPMILPSGRDRVLPCYKRTAGGQQIVFVRGQ